MSENNTANFCSWNSSWHIYLQAKHAFKHGKSRRNSKPTIIINVKTETKVWSRTAPRNLIPKTPLKLGRQNVREHSLKSADSFHMTTRRLQLSFTGFQLYLSYMFLSAQNPQLVLIKKLYFSPSSISIACPVLNQSRL